MMSKERRGMLERGETRGEKKVRHLQRKKRKIKSSMLWMRKVDLPRCFGCLDPLKPLKNLEILLNAMLLQLNYLLHLDIFYVRNMMA
jgi:hypothetical protein